MKEESLMSGSGWDEADPDPPGLERERRVRRKAERAARARAGGNHSRVWRRMSDPLAGWRERARQDIFCGSEPDKPLSCCCCC